MTSALLDTCLEPLPLGIVFIRALQIGHHLKKSRGDSKIKDQKDCGL